jgi:hypothetical protein
MSTAPPAYAEIPQAMANAHNAPKAQMAQMAQNSDEFSWVRFGGLGATTLLFGASCFAKPSQSQQLSMCTCAAGAFVSWCLAMEHVSTLLGSGERSKSKQRAARLRWFGFAQCIKLAAGGFCFAKMGEGTPLLLKLQAGMTLASTALTLSYTASA